MFSIVLGKDEDYVDKQKQHEIMQMPMPLHSNPIKTSDEKAAKNIESV